jgi:hypothetical protein
MLTRGRLISLWLYKENSKLLDWKKCIYSTYPSPKLHTHTIYDFFVQTSLANPRKIPLVVQQIGK